MVKGSGPCGVKGLGLVGVGFYWLYGLQAFLGIGYRALWLSEVV